MGFYLRILWVRMFVCGYARMDPVPVRIAIATLLYFVHLPKSVAGTTEQMEERKK